MLKKIVNFLKYVVMYRICWNEMKKTINLLSTFQKYMFWNEFMNKFHSICVSESFNTRFRM